MKKKCIFFYIILLLFALNINSSQVRSRSKSILKSAKSNKKKIRKPTKRQKRRVGRIINNYKSVIALPITDNNTLLDKKNGIKALIATLLKNSPEINDSREKIAKAIANEQFSNKGVSLDNAGNIIDTESKKIILTKDEITKLDINEEITKETIKEIAEKTGDKIIYESHGTLQKENGNIVNQKKEIIVSKESISAAVNSNATNLNNKSIESVFQPAIKVLQEMGVTQEKIDQITANTTEKIQIEVKNNLLNENEAINKKSRSIFSDLKVNEAETNDIDYFMLHLNLQEEDTFELIINAIKFFQPFNDGIIDIFGILYQFNNQKFVANNVTDNDTNIEFNNIVVLKKFILDQDKVYKKIKENIENYWTAIKLMAPILKEETTKNENTLDDFFSKEEQKRPELSSNDKINSIMIEIHEEIGSLAFDEKLKRILFYMYGLILYCHTKLNNQNENTKNDFFTVFITRLLQITKIKEEASVIFKDKMFSELTNSNIKFKFQDIKNMFEDKFTNKEKNDIYFIMHNTEFHLLLLFNIIIAMTDSEIDFKNVNVNTQLKKILDNQANSSTKTEEQNVIEAKEELVKYIKEKYTDNNIKIINNYLDTGDKKIKNTIQNQQNESVIYIPHFINFDETNSKKEYLNYFPLNRYINVYCIIDFLSKNNNTQNKNFINLYTPYFNTEKNQYSNQLYVKLFKSTKTFEKIEVEEEGELPEKEKGIAHRLEHTYSNALALEYITEMEKFTNYNNENENILELIHVMINTINLSYFFKNIINTLDISIPKIKDVNEKKKVEFIKKVHEYLNEVNNLFLIYLKAIYKVITKKRCYIKNYDENAWNKTWKDLMQASIKPAIIASIGTTAYLIGLDNLTGAAGHVINAGVDSAKWLGSIAANNPGKTIIFGSVAAVAASVYNYFRNKQQAHKDGATEMRNTLISNKIAALEELE